jgi:hypothetical protein
MTLEPTIVQAATRPRYEQTKCFLSYERSFFRPVFK